MAAESVRRNIRQYWPEAKDEVLLGIGFTIPYLQTYLEEADRLLTCMPALQGVIHWPPQARNLTMLADEAELPLPENSVHRVLVVHAIENSEHVRGMLSEIWRVLMPGGKLIVVVPNRRGIWARAPKSPFAHGQPYTLNQLRELLSEHSFTPLRHVPALFFPPSERGYVIKTARFLESAGKQFFSAFGGVLQVEAEKRIYAPITQKAHRSIRRIYVPSAQPVRSIKNI
jgi:SAM-dependent methyltransferase